MNVNYNAGIIDVPFIFKKKNILIRLFYLLLLCLPSVLTKAADIHILEDKTRGFSAQQVYLMYSKGKVPLLKQNKFSSGVTSSVYWLIVNLPRQRFEQKLVIGNPNINRLDFYRVTNGKVVLDHITGDHYPFRQRPVNNRLFVFPLLPTEQQNFYLVRVDKHNESLQLDAEVVSDAEFYNGMTEENLINALTWGILLLIIVFGTFLFISVKDKLYLYYVLYILSALLWVLADTGYGFQLLWPEYPDFANRARLFLNLCLTVTIIQFMQAFIGQSSDSRWYKPLQIIKIINIIFAVLVLTVPFPTGDANQALYVFLVIHLTIDAFTLIPFLLSIIEKVRTNNRQAWFYLISVLALMVCIFAELFEQAGVTISNTSYFQDYGVQTGIVIEAVILNFGLAIRFNRYKNDKEQLLIKINQKQNELTERIIETQESERKKIAGQLHDEVGSLLSLASLHISSVIDQNKGSQETVLKLKKADEVLHSVTTTVRNMSHTLTPLAIERYGFKNAIIDLQNTINLAGVLKIECIIIGFEERDKYNIHLLNDVYRIVQESVNNIIKHAEATHALIQVIGYDEIISVMIEDNGKGLSSSIVKKPGIGIAGIHSKIDYFGGRIEWSEKRDGGTLVNIEIPV